MRITLNYLHAKFKFFITKLAKNRHFLTILHDFLTPDPPPPFIIIQTQRCCFIKETQSHYVTKI